MPSECGDEIHLALRISECSSVMSCSVMDLIGLHVSIENKELTAVLGFVCAWDLEGSRDAGSSTFGSPL